MLFRINTINFEDNIKFFNVFFNFRFFSFLADFSVSNKLFYSFLKLFLKLDNISFFFTK